MNPLILRTGSRLLLYMIMLTAVFLLLRGHNEPGGGFIAGLMTAAAVVLQAIAFDAEYARNLIPFRESTLIAWGLTLAAGTGIGAVVTGQAFLEHAFRFVTIPVFGEIQLATAVVFDVGVYLVVVGATKWIIFTLATEEEA